MDLTDLFRQAMSSSGFNWNPSWDVRSDNPNLLFAISGGVRYEAVLAGITRPDSPRVASVQRCVRTDSLDRLGVSGRHHAGFDMLGHFSFYELDETAAKELAIVSAWRFLTEIAGLPTARLYATVHPYDQVAQAIWNLLGVPFVLQANNLDTNPRGTRCGLRSEIVWRRRDGQDVELWNLVFTQFDGAVHFERPLSRIAFDSGMSLDRLQAAVEDRSSNYDSSLWTPVLMELEAASPYADPAALRRLADLMRTVTWIVACGVEPGNKAGAHMLRKLIRLTHLNAVLLGLQPELLFQLAGALWAPGADTSVLASESRRYTEALGRGEQQARKRLSRQGALTAADIAWLADTHGYPPELSRRLL